MATNPNPNDWEPCEIECDVDLSKATGGNN